VVNEIIQFKRNDKYTNIIEVIPMAEEKMADNSSYENEYYLWTLLAQTREACIKLRKKELKRYGIETRQSAVLIAIKAIGEGATIGEISQRLVRESHSVSAIVNRMIKAGLVVKVKDPNMKSLVRVFLTKNGQKAYDMVIKRNTIHEVINVLSTKQQRQLGVHLKKMRDQALEELGNL